MFANRHFREKDVMRLTFALAAFAIALGSLPASAAGVDKLYALYCGEIRGADQSRWSPGVNVGVPIELSDNCYLIHHDKGWFLWDTGLDDTIAAKPDGVTAGNGALHMKRTKTLAAQLEALGVKPADIKGMAISHTHPDHVGNIEEFPQTMLYVQKAEYDWPAEGGGPRFKPEHPVTKLDGDYDIFGDGSVMIISTPGHTPGHQSLLVRLPKTGAVLLSGDAVHFKDNWDNRRVPGPNFNKEQSLASLQKMSDILAKEHAQLWINHDKPQSDAQKKAPDYYE
jgi:glyoxylase-like metal-dependent hydrolase (beta-lactamase superfamily II)